jgi:hypothetical protein
MMRTLNFAFILVTGLVCLGLYRIAEEARVARADLAVTERAITQELRTMAVLGAEWAHATQPARIAALAERHLALADRPSIELSSLALLPHKNRPLADAPLRTAKAIMPLPAQAGLKVVAFRTGM